MKSNKAQEAILIVDDSHEYLTIIGNKLGNAGYRIYAAPNGIEALKIVEAKMPNLILLDIVMDEIDGFEVCRRIKSNINLDIANIPVIFITSFDERTEKIIECFRVGGVDYITKTSSDDELFARVENHLDSQRLAKELRAKTMALEQKNQEMLQEIKMRRKAEEARRIAEEARQNADEQLSLLSEQEATKWGIEGFVGKSKTIKVILDKMRRLQSADTNVLILGESGTGKELVARAIHKGSSRIGSKFYSINGAGIPGELFESHLFGSVKGGFTGAVNRKGYFELCAGGTLFIDEIGDMPAQVQVKLLTTLDEGYYTPVGSTTRKQADVRIISATNADIDRKIDDGEFRADLYFRLAGYVINVPPLRERKEDIPLLAAHFLNITDTSKRDVKLSAEALEALDAYHFPGNIRELKNIIDGALIDCIGKEILPMHLHLRHADSRPMDKDELMESLVNGLLTTNQKYSDIIREFKQNLIKHVLIKSDWNRHEASRILQTDRSNLLKLIRGLNIIDPES